MRNLKRALSLALAAIMIIGMMVVGASAVDYKDFTDNGDIVNRDAVTMLTTLGVIDGKPDGTYAPTELVTRDQMAKMISVILNQGADVNDVYSNLDSGLTDISTNWAKGHINYCYTLGVIAGRGDGTFDPGANVTAAEAAKMLLVAAGYDPATEGFVGAQWSWNVNAKASSLGIYKNYTKGVLEPLNRDDAALLIYNALDIERIERYENGYARVYNDNRTILSSLYGVYKMVGVVTGNEWARLEGTGIDDALAVGKTTVSNPKILASETLQTQIFGAKEVNSRQFNVSTDLDMLGKAVTMFIRKETVLNNIEVLGVVLNEELNNVVTVAANKTKETDVLKDSGLATKAGETAYYVNYGYVDDAAAAQTRLGISKANANGIVMECIDNDDDGIVEYVLYCKEDLAVVSKVSKDGDEVTLRGVNNNDSIDVEDIVTDATIELDDVLLVISFGGRYYISEPQIVSGEMNSYTAKKNDEEAIEVDGVDYKPSAIGKLDQTVTSANGVGDIIDVDVQKCEKATGVEFGITYDFFLDSNGYMRAFRPTSQSLPSYALVINSGYDPGVYSSDASGKVTVLLADGSEGTYPINFSTSAANLAKQLYKEADRAHDIGGVNIGKTDFGVVELKGFLGTDYTDNSPTRPWRFNVTDNADGHFQFAYRSAEASNSQEARADYQSGQAAGYVIQYTLSDSGVMTIKYVMGTVNDGVDIDYSLNMTTNANDTYLSARPVHTVNTIQNTLFRAYGSGSARVYWDNTNAVAVDKNTVAFYYDEVSEKDKKDKYASRSDVAVGDTLYGVAVGYDNMADVQKGANFMASTVIRTTYNTTTKAYEYNSTNLADVILFDEANIITARDYAFVLSANRKGSNDTVTLNVLFEDGTAGELVVSRSNFNDIIGDETSNNENFLKPYAYTIDANDKATIYKGNPQGPGFIFRLKKETVAMDSIEQFWAYDINNVKIWDVTDQDAGEDGLKLADFYNQDNQQNYKGYLILNSDNTVRTAFIWETDDKTPGVSTSHNHNWDSYMKLADGYERSYRDNVSALYEAFDNEHDVEFLSDLTLGATSLQIPKGRTVKVNGDMDLNRTRVSGEGVLWVTGDLKTNTSTSISGITVIVGGDLNVTDDFSIGSLMYVGGDVNLTASKDLTIASAGDVHVKGDMVGSGSNEVEVNGHLDVEGNFNADIVRVYSDKTLIVRGVLTIGTSLTIGDGSKAGRVIVYNEANVNTVGIAANGKLEIMGTNAQTFKVTNEIKSAKGSEITGNHLDVSAATTTEIAGKIDLDTFEFGGTSPVLKATATGEIDKIIGTVAIKTEAGSTVEIKDTKATVKVDETVSGTFAGDVATTKNTEIAADTEAEINGDLNLGTYTVTVNGELTLKGSTSGSTGTIAVGDNGKLVVDNGSADAGKAVDVTKITVPENAESKAEISFASDAKLTGDLSSNSNYWEYKTVDGVKTLVKITNASELAGRTFKVGDVSGVVAQRTVTLGWVATDSKVVTPTNKAVLGENAVTVSSSDYTVKQDSQVITLTGNKGSAENMTITFKLSSGQTIGLVGTEDGVKNLGGGKFQVTFATCDGEFTVRLAETGKESTDYTVKFAAKTTPAPDPTPETPGEGGGEATP